MAREFIGLCKVIKFIFMKKKYFCNQSYFEFAIISKKITAEEITKKLGIQPDRTFKKGDIVQSAYSTHIGKKRYHLWAISSPKINTNIENLDSHFLYLATILESAMEMLEYYKKATYCELSLWIWVETEAAGIGFDFTEEQLVFINKICNRCSFSLLAT